MAASSQNRTTKTAASGRSQTKKTGNTRGTAGNAASNRTASNKNSSNRSSSNRTTSNRTTSNRNTSNRNTASSRGYASKRKNSGNRKTQDDGLRNEIQMIVCFALCILLFLCNFTIMGPFGGMVKGVMFGLFGILSYVLPIAVFVGMAFHISNQGSAFATRKIIAGIIILVCTGIFAEMIAVPLEEMEGNLIVNLYQASREGYRGGGLLCGLIAYPMQKYMKVLGSILILCIFVIISIVIITERSLINGVRKGSKKVYETAKESAERHKEERMYRQEQEENYDDYEEEGEDEPARGRVLSLQGRTRPQEAAEEHKSEPRIKKKVSGIMADTTLKKEEENVVRENMHEITIEDLEPDTAQTEPTEKLPTMEEGFEFDLYPQISEPRGDFHQQEYVAQDQISMDIPDPLETPDEFSDRSETDGHSEDTVRRNGYKIEGADTFGEALQSGYEPQKPPHSFGVTEGYQTPDEKKNTAFSVKPAAGQIAGKAAESGSLTAPVKPKKYIFPSLNLLKKGIAKAGNDSGRQLKETAARLQQTLKTFGVNVTITNISQGPAVTRYEMQPEVGVKVSKIVGLADDIKLNLAATDIRIEAPIPGKAAVGIEVPNKENSAVHLRDLLEADEFRKFDSKIAFAVGKDISGKTVVFDIGKMPHVLIAGSTGSGKSVCINTLIMSILYKAHPDDVKMIMVDPKVVELSVYNGIPHLLIPVVTDPKKAAAALQWAVAEMTDRYKKFADSNVRDLKGYNAMVESRKDASDTDTPAKLPQIVIIVDELADLMMVASGDVEEAIVRLAQLARAAGIHLVIATQRPSVDVITGLIKANMPSRIAFAVSSGVDSRTILDMNGAEKLLGKGDMLFYPQGYSKPVRVQGAFVSDKEVSDVVDFLKNQAIGNVYGEELEQKISQLGAGGASQASGTNGPDIDELFAEAGRFIIEKDKASIGMLQRAFRIGFNRAARIMDQLSDAGVVGEEEGTKPRKVLMSPEQFENYIETM